MEITDKEFGLLRQHLFNESGIDISEEKRYLFSTRLSELCAQEKCTSFSEFYRLLSSGFRNNLTQMVTEAMTTHESGFFRDGHPFQLLVDTILPEIAVKKKQLARFLPPRIRILSAGCSFGQEPYTIALCVRRWLLKEQELTAQNISIMGIDISTRALEVARKGRYSELELGKQLSGEDRRNHFTKESDRFVLASEIRDMVSFKCVNLSKPLGDLGKFDILFCRNVIIYFPRETKLTVLGQLRSVLEPDGILFLGSTESMYHLSNEFVMHTAGQTSYYTVDEVKGAAL